MANKDNTVKVTGSRDFSGGVDSAKVSTVSSTTNPNGLAANQLVWLSNGTMRDGCLSPRDGWQLNGVIVGPTVLTGLLSKSYQGKSPYVPISGNPYEIHVIGGHIVKVDPTFGTPPVDLSDIYDLSFPAPLAPRCYFGQAEQFLVIQAGDYNPVTKNGTLPLIWDGAVLKQSNGITGITSFGEGIANTYTVPFTAPFTVPSVGNSVNVYTNTIYGGNKNDLVTVSVSPSSTGPDSGGTMGIFTVTFFSGGLTLKCVSLAGGTLGTAGYSVPVTDNPLLLTITIPTGTQSVSLIPFTNSTTIFALVPANGASINLGLTLPYTGNVGDSVYISGHVSGDAYGVYQVTAYDPATMLITLLGTATQNVGTSIAVPDFFQLTAGIPVSQNFMLIPPVGQFATLPFNGSFPNGYAGSIGDTITIPGAGTFLVVGNFNASPVNVYGTAVQLQAVAPINVGTLFPLSFTLTFNSGTTTPAGSIGENINQIPATGPMIYYMGRLWYATGKTANAGDIVGSSASGTRQYNFTDSVLSVTENPLVLGGDGFTMPSGSDNITGFSIPQMINASLGQGLLNIGTLNAIFALQVPVSRADWIAADSSNAPQVFVVQQSNGFVNDWSCVGVNGDIWFQSQAADIRSLLTAVRYFQQWGNVSLSSNEQLILDDVNRSLLNFASGIYFDNRLWMTTLPQQTPFGTVHTALIPTDFQPISTLEEQLPPNWEGNSEGLQIFQLASATFSGVQRAFAATLSQINPGQIECWELVPGSIGDNGKNIEWQSTHPSFTWSEHELELELKKLVSGELWVDQLQGTATIFIEYCPDGSACWYPWHKFAICSAPDSSLLNPGYPVIEFEQGVRRPLVLPLPPDASNAQESRPANVAFEFQPRITITGQCRIRGLFLKAERVNRPLYEGLVE